MWCDGPGNCDPKATPSTATLLPAHGTPRKRFSLNQISDHRIG